MPVRPRSRKRIPEPVTSQGVAQPVPPPPLLVVRFLRFAVRFHCGASVPTLGQRRRGRRLRRPRCRGARPETRKTTAVVARLRSLASSECRKRQAQLSAPSRTTSTKTPTTTRHTHTHTHTHTHRHARKNKTARATDGTRVPIRGAFPPNVNTVLAGRLFFRSITPSTTISYHYFFRARLHGPRSRFVQLQQEVRQLAQLPIQRA